MLSHGFAITLCIVVAWGVHGKPHTQLPETHLNSTSLGNNTLHNGTEDVTVGARISSILKDLPTLKNIVIFICVLTTLLIICLVFKVYR